jgi:hypothetical protein
MLAPRRRGDQDGIVAGGEAVLLGTLVFVVGTLLLISMWTIVDAKLAVEAAAREATRAVVESPATVLGSVGAPQGVAESAALSALTAQRGAPGTGPASWQLVDVVLDGDYERCGRIEATVQITVDTPRLPFIDRRFAAGTLEGTHLERIEPYRAGLPVPSGGITC